jgi:hypothetical protein
MGYTGRTNRCSSCGDWGHNRRGCPEIKAAYEKVLKLCAKYGIEIAPDACYSEVIKPLREKQMAAHSVSEYYDIHHIDHEEHVSYWEGSRFMEQRERLVAAARRKERGAQRQCSFCGKTGHNRRNCPEKEAHERECRAMKALAHRVARMTFEAAGIVPGALIQYREFDYITRDYVDRVGLVQGIDWSQIGKQDVENSSGLGNVLEYWLFRGSKAIIIKDHQGRTGNIAVPRNIEQQSDYFGDMHNQYKLICPVHGSRVNLDGYEGDSEFPVSMPVYMWGGKWMNKRFGNKVIKAIKEVGSELIVA